ncbi:MAG TPA: hypothetical protein VGD40_11355 [Chryseosolibacter sp.]
MISVTSVTDKYILQPSLLAEHRRTLDWLSATVLWNKELNFFQKRLDKYAGKFVDAEDKKKVDHFQSIVTYYKLEVLVNLSEKLRNHERKLADMLETRDETKTEYFKEHADLMKELESANIQLSHYKDELFSFIEKVM